MIVINKRDSHRLLLGTDSDRLRYVLERAIALIMKQQDTVAGCDGQIGVPIVVVVGGGAGDCVQFGIETGFLCDIFEFAAPSIVKKRDSSLRSSIGKQEIRVAVVIEIKKACSGPNLIGSRHVGGWRSRGSQS